MKTKFLGKIPLLALSGVLLAGCNPGGGSKGKHEHIGEWYADEYPTASLTGKAVFECEECGFTKEFELPVLGDSGYRITGNTATCTEGGKANFTYQIDDENSVSFRANTNPKGHTLGNLVEADPATEQHIHGHSAYYQCLECNGYFDSEKAPTTWDAIKDEWFESDVHQHWHGSDSKENHTYVLGEKINDSYSAECSKCGYKMNLVDGKENVVDVSTTLDMAKLGQKYPGKFQTSDGAVTIANGITLVNGFTPVGSGSDSTDHVFEFEDHSLYIAGTFYTTGRYMKITVKDAATLKLRLRNNSQSDVVFGYWTDISGATTKDWAGRQTPVASVTATTNADNKEIIFPEAGTYYLGTVVGGVHIYEMSIEYAQDAIHSVGEMDHNDKQCWFKCGESGCDVTFGYEDHTYAPVSGHPELEKCARCGYEHNVYDMNTEGHKLPTEQEYTAHTWVNEEYTVTKEATILEAGSKERVCSVCGYKDIVEIEQIDIGTLPMEDAVYNFGSSVITNKKGNNKVADGLYYLATSDKSIDSVSTSNTSSGGKSNPDSRVVLLKTSGAVKLTIASGAKTDGTEVTIGLFDGAPNETAANFVEGAYQATSLASTKNTPAFTISIPEAGTYYIGGNGGFKIASITVEVHTAQGDWQKDATSHWHTGPEGCETIFDKADHDFGDGDTCACGYVKPAQCEHVKSASPVLVEDVQATSGYRFDYKCTLCNEVLESSSIDKVTLFNGTDAYDNVSLIKGDLQIDSKSATDDPIVSLNETSFYGYNVTHAVTLNGQPQLGDGKRHIVYSNLTVGKKIAILWSSTQKGKIQMGDEYIASKLMTNTVESDEISANTLTASVFDVTATTHYFSFLSSNSKGTFGTLSIYGFIVF